MIRSHGRSGADCSLLSFSPIAGPAMAFRTKKGGSGLIIDVTGPHSTPGCVTGDAERTEEDEGRSWAALQQHP